MKKQIYLFIFMFCSVLLSSQEIIKDLNIGGESGVASSQNILFQNRLFFHGSNRANSPGTVWITDGTDAGTIPAPGLGIITDFSHAVNTGNRFYFVGYGAVVSLYYTDGTSSNTKNIFSLDNVSLTQLLRFEESKVLMLLKSNPTLNSPDQLWISNGTILGTVKIRDILTSSNNTYISSRFNNLTLVYDYSSNSKFEALISDGSAAGTSTVLDYLLRNNFDKFSSVISCFGQDSLLLVSGVNNKGLTLSYLLDKNLRIIKELSAPDFATFNRLQMYDLGEKGIVLQSGSHLYSYHKDSASVSNLSTILLSGSEILNTDGKLYAYFRETSGNHFVGVTDGTVTGTKKITGWQSTVLSETNIKKLANYIYFITETSGQVKEIHTAHTDSLVARKFDDFGGRFRPSVLNATSQRLIYSKYTADKGVELYRYPTEGPSGIVDPERKKPFEITNSGNASIILNFNNSDDFPIHWALHDQNGRLIKNSVGRLSANNSLSIPLNSYTSGIYLLQVSFKDQNYFEKVIIP